MTTPPEWTGLWACHRHNLFPPPLRGTAREGGEPRPIGANDDRRTDAATQHTRERKRRMHGAG
jgi:hypothetical protein